MVYISKLAGSLIMFLYNFTGNYGVALILFALIFKLVLMPLSLKASRASQKQMELQPQVNEIQRKYKDNPEMQGRELQELYRKNNISLFGGCLPLLIQLPLIIAVFSTVSRPLTYCLNLDQAEVTRLTAQVQTAQYKEVAAANENNLINFEFLGMNIGHTPQFKFDLDNMKLWIFPLLSGLTTYFAIKLAQGNTKKEKKEVPDEPQQTMNNMNTITPLMSAYISFVAPIGLSIYWIVGNIFQVIQQKYILPAYIKFEEKNENKNDVSYTVIEEKDVSDNTIDSVSEKTEPIEIKENKEEKNNKSNNNNKKGKKKRK